jgi:hypothetical protein
MPEQTYIYALQCPVTSEIRYVGKSDRPYERLKEHTAWVRRWKKHAKIKRLFHDHQIPVPDPRTSAKGAWLWSLDKRRLAPRLVRLTKPHDGVLGEVTSKLPTPNVSGVSWSLRRGGL